MQTSVAPSLAKLFGFRQKEAVAIMGSGGKTTLLWYLARAFRSEKILVTPTTKLFLPQQKYPQEYYDRLCDPAALALLPSMPSPHAPQHTSHYNDFQAASQAVSHEVPTGITLAGCLHAAAPPHGPASPCHPPADATASAITQGMGKSAGMPQGGKKRRKVADTAAFDHKITPLEADLLTRQTELFDKIFMECDGARNLPLKGWSSREPVIPDFSTTVIVVIPLWAVGLTASDTTIHRPELFYAMAQCQQGDIITLEHLTRVITHVIAHHQGPLAQGYMRSEGGNNHKAKLVLFLHSSDENKPENSRPGNSADPQNMAGENASGINNTDKNTSPNDTSETSTAILHTQGPSGQTARQLLALLPREVLAKTSRIITGSARSGWGNLLWSQEQ